MTIFLRLSVAGIEIGEQVKLVLLIFLSLFNEIIYRLISSNLLGFWNLLAIEENW